jgi:hypothetical protein
VLVDVNSPTLDPLGPQAPSGNEGSGSEDCEAL